MTLEVEEQVDFHLFGEAYQQITEVFDFLVCGIVLIDEASRRIVYANNVAKHLSQWEDTEMMGGLCHDSICTAAIHHCPLLDHNQNVECDEKVLVGKLGNHIPVLKRIKKIEIDGHAYILESFTDIRAQKEKQIKLESLNETDTLKGLPNRAGLERLIENLFTKENDEGQVNSLIMVDMDLLKNVNDSFGHQAGDDVLREFSAILKESMRKIDVVFRWGGDEFLIFARNTDGPTAILIAERLRTTISELPFPLTGHVTASFGVAQSRQGEPFEKWFRRTDFCLSKAKKDGRNRVVDWESFVNLVWSQGKIPWINILESGNVDLDNDHRALLDKINGLFIRVNPLSVVAKNDFEILDFISDYKKHMTDEEKLFQGTEYPLIDQHIHEHERIFKDLTDFQHQFQSGSLDHFSLVDYVVREIFVYHMSMEDTKFFPYLKTRES
ncbi:MAG: diguanylate cyclase [Erysipelotrichales bacterium]|nr:MAG: diguanylate cyclase [Erysipelotrichales bacterium]